MAAVQMGSNLQEHASRQGARRPGPWAPRTPGTSPLGRGLAGGLARGLALSLELGLGLGLASGLNPVRADVVFQNCVPVAGGGITCDTRPEGNTLMNDEAARYGLFDQASPGWDEFEPYQGYDDMFGGNET